MRRIAVAVLMTLLLIDTAAAAVLCAKPRKGGIFNSNVKVREACKPGETQLAPEDVGFCCTPPSTSSTTSTSTTTSSCPIYTSTSLGVPDCGGSGTCFGLCANARQCEPNAE